MRDLLVWVASLGVVVGGYFGFRYQFQQQQAQIQQRFAVSQPSSSPSTTVRNKTKKQLGVNKHESTNHRRYEQKRLARSRARTSGEVTESDQLPHLYQTEEQPELFAAVGEAEDLSSSEQPSKTTVIAGVPVAAWVKANRDKLKDSQITPPTEQGLRVFLGCLELKKGASSTTDKYTCEKILAHRDAKIPSERGRY